MISKLTKIEELQEEIASLKAELAKHKEIDESYMSTVDAGRLRALEILGAGNYDNVDHAAEKVMAELAQVKADKAELLAAGKGLLALMDEAGWSLGDESDRVFTQYEFDELRAQVAKHSK